MVAETLGWSRLYGVAIESGWSLKQTLAETRDEIKEDAKMNETMANLDAPGRPPNS